MLMMMMRSDPYDRRLQCEVGIGIGIVIVIVIAVGGRLFHCD